MTTTRITSGFLALVLSLATACGGQTDHPASASDAGNDTADAATFDPNACAPADNSSDCPERYEPETYNDVSCSHAGTSCKYPGYADTPDCGDYALLRCVERGDGGAPVWEASQ